MDPLASQFDRFRTQGDLQALGAVFDALAPRLLPVAMHLTGRPTDAEDALQQTFLLAMDRAASFDATRRLEPWLAGLLQNVVRNQSRLDRRRRTEPLPEVATDELGPLAVAEREELVARLRTHVDALPADQRQVLRLQLQHGLTPAQIAEALELPPGAVRMRLHRGLDALRKFLPAGLAALLASALPAQGLPAVKQFVLAAAKERLVTAAVASSLATKAAPLVWLSGVLAMKKILTGVSLAVLLGVCWWLTTLPQAEAPRELLPVAAVPPPVLVANATENETSAEDAAAARQQIDSPTAKPDAEQPGPTELWGRVVDAASQSPIADADVELQHRAADEFWNLDLPYGEHHSMLRRARTRADGTFRFDVARARPHRLCVTAAGYASTTVVGNTGGSIVVVELPRGASLHGVVKEGERLLADMEVRVAAMGSMVEPAAGRTDAGGAFRFTNLPPANVAYVMVSSPRYEEEWVQVQLVDGQHHEVTVVLEPGQTLRGQVVDDVTGTPIVDAQVSDSWTFQRVARTRTDGTFELAGLRDQGFVALQVRAHGYASWSENVGGALARTHVVRLQRGGELVGRLVDPAGTPIVDAYVAVAAEIAESAGVRGNDWLRAPVGPDGRFVALGLRPNLRYSVMARSPGRGTRIHLLPRLLAAGERHDVGDVVLAAASGLEGLVVDDQGTPLARAEVHVRATNSDGHEWSGPGPDGPPMQFLHRDVLTNANGVFRITDLAAGEYTVSASLPGLPATDPQKITVEAGTIMEGVKVVVVRGLSLRGVVRRADGVALDGAVREQLWLMASDPTEQTLSARVDADGKFAIQGLKPGRCSLMALRAPKGWSLAPMQVEAGTSDLQLVLQPSSFVAGVVVDGEGKPLQTHVTVWPEGGTGASLRHSTDPEGKFRVEVPPTFVGKVMAQHPADPLSVAELGDVRAGASDLRLVMKPFGR